MFTMHHPRLDLKLSCSWSGDLVTNSFVDTEISMKLNVKCIFRCLAVTPSEEDRPQEYFVKEFLSSEVINEEWPVPMSHLLSFRNHDDDLRILVPNVILEEDYDDFIQKLSDYTSYIVLLTIQGKPKKMEIIVDITTIKMAADEAELVQQIMMELTEANEVESALRESMEDNEVPTCPASQSAIEALKVKNFDEGDSTTSCIFCLEDFSLGADVTMMPCSHIFDGDCIVRWLQQKNECPLCRFQMPVDGDMMEI
ncbi:hypothetical protein GIB67_028124 [Kingdonia uniflora]|uniref:RING-type domain-containing protein n=1 Tax=Kingdonia uniflora TaxID=39325 RepID=A0A7J7KZJ8_9MAGN|nr:hypothetical protein GIB67_028124 [Kingdonia uniflora]